MDKKIIKKILYDRAIPLFIAIVIVAGYSIFSITTSKPKIETRTYNLNLAESFNLDNINLPEETKWETDDDNIMIKNNIVTALKSGKSHVYAKQNDKIVYEIDLNVLTGDESLSISEHNFTAIPGESKQISVISNNNDTNNSLIDNIINMFKPNNKSKKKKQKTKEKINNDITSNEKNSEKEEAKEEVEYKSSDEKVAVVDEDGEIEAISPGTAEIEVKDKNGNKDHAVITVKEDELTIYNKNYTLYKGDEVIIGHSLNSTTYSLKDIKWVSNNNNVVKVDATGKMSALNIGTAVITASVASLEEKINVEVKENIILPTDIELLTTSVGLLIGESITITGKTIPENATDSKLTWTSNNSDIATVNNGTIIGKGEGNTSINVSTSNGIKKEINVIITKKNQQEGDNIDLKTIKINVGDLTMEAGTSTKINAILEPSNATNKDIIWQSSNTEVATINQNGTISAQKEGNTTITVSAVKNSEIKASINLTVKKNSTSVSNVIINENNVKVKVGGESRLTATVLPSTAVNKEIVWKSNNTSIATIDSNGTLKAISAGTTTIEAISKENLNIKGSCTVIVENIEVTDIIISNTSVTLKKGASTTITASAQPENATIRTLTWTSNNSSIASANNDGKITASSVGTATITVKSNSNQNVYKKITVEVIPNSTVYTSLHNLGKISIGNPVLTIPSIDSHTIPQGFTIADNYYIAAKIKSDGSSAYIHVYNKNTLAKVSAFKVENELGHANDIGYNQNTGQIYFVMTVDKNFRYTTLTNIVAGINSMSQNAFIYNGAAKSFSGVDYDVTTNKYYAAVSNNVFVYSNFTTLDRSFSKIDKDTPQGIGAYNGKILVIRYNGSANAGSGDIGTTRNAIDIYRAANGDYLGSYEINTSKELEAISYNKSTNKFALYFGDGGIHEVKINIPE